MDDIRQYEKKVFDLRQLLEISRALNSTLDYYYLIQAILDMCLAQAQTLRAGLFLTPDMDSDIIMPVSVSKDFDMPNNKSSIYELDLKTKFMQYLEKNKKAVTMVEMRDAFPNEEYTKVFTRLEVELIVPITARSRLLGMIILCEKMTREAYSNEDISFLIDLASLSGIAVTNARLYDMATIDQMTKLKNHAYFQTILRDEMEKAIKRSTPLALLFSDVDYFKKFNDSYGHQTGDIALKSVARVLQKCTRKNDLAARYGGEEFCVILPGATESGAMYMAERIRSNVEDIKIPYNSKTLHISISVGVALFDPKKDKVKKDFIEKADKALFACKKNGRNQVQFYNEKM